MKESRTLALLLGSSLLVGGLLVLLSFHAPLTHVQQTPTPLCSWSPHSITAFEVVHEGTNHVKLARTEEGSWRLLLPYRAPVDEPIMMRLLDQLTLVPVTDVRAADELNQLHENFDDYGLQGDSFLVLTLHQGRNLLTIRLGARTASQREVYARVDRSKDVLTLPVSVLDAIPLTAEGYRRRTVFKGTAEDLQGIDFRASETPFVRLERAKAGWMLTAPLDASADHAAVNDLVRDLFSAQAQTFVVPSTKYPNRAESGGTILPSVLTEYGLSDDRGRTVTLRLKSGEIQQVVFGAHASSNSVFALVQKGTAIVTLNDQLAQRCQASVSSLCDQRVFPLGEDEKIQSISVSDGETVYVLQCATNGVWTQSSPTAAPADQSVVARVVTFITNLKRHEILAKESLQSGLYLSLSTSTTSYPGVRIAKSLFDQCCAVADLRSKVFFEVDTEAIQRLTLKTGETNTCVLVRENTTEKKWVSAPSSIPVRTAINQEHVKALLAALSHVEAVGIETTAATLADMARCGLDKPTRILALDFDNPQRIRQNLILGGATPGGGRYARVGGGVTIFVLARASVQDLLQNF